MSQGFQAQEYVSFSVIIRGLLPLRLASHYIIALTVGSSVNSFEKLRRREEESSPYDQKMNHHRW